jgi:PKD repeat protein
MYQERQTGAWLTTAAVVCMLFVLSGAAGAQTPAETLPLEQVTTGTIPETTQPTPSQVNVTANPLPILILGVPDIDNLTCTMYGTAAPGSVNVAIESIRWNWGDSHIPEYHGFPYSHVYASPGTYTVSITALQSDGQNFTRKTNISVQQPFIPVTLPVTLNISIPGPGIAANAPVLTLLEPVIDGMNVTLNGNLNPGSPGVTITSVLVTWDDGAITNSTDLPVTHRYANPGLYTITITGKQSDGQITTKRITLDLKVETPAFPGPASSAPPPNNLPVFFIILATAIAVVVIGALAQRFMQRKRGSFPEPVSPKASPPRGFPLPENLLPLEELGRICSGTDVSPAVLDSVIQVAVEIAREGREGQPLGTSFVIGDAEKVLFHSKQFVLNPYHGHDEAERQITDAGTWGHIKEFAQLDGAFVITGIGVVEAAGRYLTADTSQVKLPGGLGSRHSSVAGITLATKSIGVVVSQSGGLITIFRGGKILYTINS